MFKGGVIAAFVLLALFGAGRRCEGAQAYGVYESTDAGTTWRELSHPFRTNRVNALHAVGDRVWAGTEHSLFVSRDTGKSWRDIGQTQLVNVQAIVSAHDVLIVGSKNGVWRKRENGDWSRPSELKDQFIRAAATDGQRFFAGTDRGEVFVSEDKGMTWKSQSSGLPPNAQIFELKTDAGGQLFAGLYSLGYYTFRDDAWQNLGAPFAFTILPIDSTLIAGGNPGGVVRSDDNGKSWTAADGLRATAPTWMLFKTRQSLFVGAWGKSGLYRSGDLGKNWSPVAEKEFGDKAVVTMTAVGDTLLLATVERVMSDSLNFGHITGIIE
jgi:photosystem II stability/assembly factor-like uncharacterized protein